WSMASIRSTAAATRSCPGVHFLGTCSLSPHPPAGPFWRRKVRVEGVDGIFNVLTGEEQLARFVGRPRPAGYVLHGPKGTLQIAERDEVGLGVGTEDAF